MSAKIDESTYDQYFKSRIEKINPEFEFVSICKFNDRIYSHDIIIKHKVCGDTFTIRLGNFMSSNHCPYCYGSKTNHRVFLEKFKKRRPDDYNEYEILSEYERNDKPITVKHIPCGRIFDITPTALMHTKDKCACVYNRYTHVHTFDILNKRVHDLDPEYILVDCPNKSRIHTTKHKVTFKHLTCGTVFKTRPHSFIHVGIRCPKCSKSIMNKHDSFGVVTIERWLQNNHLYYKRESTFNKLRSPMTNRKLRFDFYMPDLNLVIEYDGKQHVDTHTNGIFTEEKYERIHLYDEVKNKFCKENDITLLRISHKLKESEIIDILNNLLTHNVYVYPMYYYDTK